MLICLRVRRFFWDNGACAGGTFAEQVPGLSAPYARRTPLLRGMLEQIALAVGGRPGERLAQRLAVAVSRMTLLRMIRALPLAEPGVVAVLGVDDFATRRGHTYGTILVDMDTHQPVDLLPDRLADTFADWLRAHPGAEVICRDRASGYAEGARLGAPDAIQVADRFHLLYNLTDAVDRVVRAHRKYLRDQSALDDVAQPAPAPPAVPDVVEGRRAELTRQRWAEVHALSEKGVGTSAISKALNLDHKTVLRYARAATADELLTAMPRRASELDAHTPLTWPGAGNRAARTPSGSPKSCGPAAIAAASSPCVACCKPGVPASPQRRAPPPPRRSLVRSPGGSSARPVTAPRMTKPTSRGSWSVARSCGPSTSWSATSQGCFGNGTASTWTPGSPRPGRAISRGSRGSPTACSRITTPCATDSPSRGAAARSGALSRSSRPSRERCTAGRTSTFGAPRDVGGGQARRLGPEHLEDAGGPAQRRLTAVHCGHPPVLSRHGVGTLLRHRCFSLIGKAGGQSSVE